MLRSTHFAVTACALVGVLGAACGGTPESLPDGSPVRATQAATPPPCVFGPPGNEGTPVQRGFSVDLPNGVSAGELALATAGGTLALGSGAAVLEATSGWGRVSGLRSPVSLNLGTKAEVGDVFADPGVDLGTKSSIHGALKTSGTYSLGTGAVIDGPISQHANLGPFGAFAFSVHFPSANRGSCTLQPGKSQAIEPGSYGDWVAKPEAHFQLRSGTYFLSSLSLESNAVLDVDNTSGPVFVFIANSMNWRGSLVEARPGSPAAFFGVAGTSEVLVATSLTGILVAPGALVTLGPKADLVGSVFAKAADLKPNTVLRHRGFSAEGYCTGPIECSSLCPCGPGGACRADPECRAGLVCQGATPSTLGACATPGVDDSNPCTADSYDPVLGIVHVPVPAGTSCGNGNACDGDELCDAAGVCVAGSAPDVEDHNPCTVDSCDPVTGVRHLNAPLGTDCSDGNACNGAESCDGVGTCQLGEPPLLDDGNPCTLDACSALGGLTHMPVAGGTSCPNSDACDGSESCDDGGHCLPGVSAVLDDGDPCTVDACDPTSGVSHTPAVSGTSCSDANPCNGSESCDGSGQCRPGQALDLDDRNACTLDSCDPTSGVVHQPLPAGTSCADADHCNGEEHCSAAGICVASAPSSVDDGNPCTVDACEGGVSTHTPVAPGTSCGDGDSCNGASSCNAAGSCVPGPAPSVGDGNPCTIDACSPSAGVTHTPVAAGTSCSDANACNGAEVCGVAGDCQPGAPTPSDDGNPCTLDHCDPVLGVQHDPVPIGTSCADADACNGIELCDGFGGCVPAGPPNLDDANPCTLDTCDPALGISHTPVAAGSACGNLDACDGEELCDAGGACRSGAPLLIDDYNPCTVDSCDAVAGVGHESAPVGTACGDGNACNGAEACDGNGSCATSGPPQLLVLTSPMSGGLTREALVTISGTTQSAAPVHISVDPPGVSTTLPGGSEPRVFALSVPLNNGENNLTVAALDENGCAASLPLVVIRDSQPPLVTLDAPTSLSSSAPAHVVVTAVDARGVVEVRLTLSLDGQVVFDQARSAPPYAFDVPLPAAARAGNTLVLEARAVDSAGNTGQASTTSVVTADALVIGRIVSDASGRPIGGASVRLGTQTVAARADGRYTLTAAESEVVVSAWQRGFTGVERRTPIEFGTGSVAVDARLTPLTEPILISGDDVTLESDIARWDAQPITASLLVPAASFSSPVGIHLTPLTQQGLPGLLPLGWSPVAAFELRLAASDAQAPELDPEAAFSPVATPLTLKVNGLPEASLGWVSYDRQAHQWRSLGGLTPSGAATGIPLNALAAYAIVVADSGNGPSLPASGAVLTGLGAVAFPGGVSAQGAGVPDSLPAGGGLAEGRIALSAPDSLPSGTVIAAVIAESYALSSGRAASTDPLLQDLVLYRAQAPTLPGLDPALVSLIGARFPIAPSFIFGTSELGKGKIHIDVLGGREAHRGKIGGRAPAVVEHAGATLSVVAGSLEADTVLDIEHTDIDAFVPRTSELVPLAQVAVDFSGVTLLTGAALSLSDLAVTPEETPFLARLARVDGTPYPEFVAFGAYDGSSWTFAAGDGFSGLLKEGTYVAYRTTLPLGFVAGTTRAAGAPVPALVTVAGLPFIGSAALSGAYKIPVRAGEAALTAKVPGTNLAAHATASVTAGQTTQLDLDLLGEVTSAVVSPADGDVGVARTTQIELTTPIALDPTTVSLEHIRLFAGDPANGVLVGIRLQLAASGRSVAVIPEVRLEAAASYTLEASGLRDALGGLVVVPVTRFKTAAEVPPTVNTNPISVSLPEGGGNATVSIPPGTVAPGTTVIVTNEGNGQVTGCSVGNTGGVNCEIPASIDDTLVISITDPEGNTTSFRRGQYQLADGRTAVGPGGGVVTGPGGVELRIPEGALAHGVTFKIEAVPLSAVGNRPYSPDSAFGSALQVETQGNPFFGKEVDIAFPKPPNAPDGAYYYIYRRLDLPTGQAFGPAFEVIDHAFPDGNGPNARIVTASCPFSGVMDNIGIAGRAGAALALFGLRAIEAFHEPAESLVHTLLELRSIGLEHEHPDAAWPENPSEWLLNRSIFVLEYTYSQVAPGAPTPGLVRGRVVRPRFLPGATEPEFLGVHGALVSAFGANGQPLTSDPAAVITPPPAGQSAPVVAQTQVDGTFTLWDPLPERGLVQIKAALPGQDVSLPCPTTNGPDDVLRCVTGVQEVISTCANNVRQYRNQVKANLTFPPVESPPPPSAIDIRIFRESGGQRQLTNGLSASGDSLVFTFTAQNAEVRSVDILHQGVTESVSVGPDPFAGQPLSGSQMARFSAGAPGTYTVSATALPLPSGSPISRSMTFRVVAAGGDITEPVPNERPRVIDARTSPVSGADGVHPTVHPQVVFSEPVKNVSGTIGTVPGNVQLSDSQGGLVEVDLVGVGTDGLPIALNGSAGPQRIITSLTIEPKRRLKFDTTYTLLLKDGIYDLDNTLPDAAAAPNLLVPYQTTFKTLKPEALTAPSTSFSSAGIATLHDRAYVVENNYRNGVLRSFDVSDPTSPMEVSSAQRQMAGRPMDLDVMDDGAGGANVVVVTGPADVSFPSNLRIYHVSQTGQSAWVGAATLTPTAAEGIVRRVVAKGNFAYAITSQKGIQLVDLTFARQLFEQGGGDTSRLRVPFNTDAQGFGHEAVVATVPMLRADGRPAFLTDLAVVDLVDGFSQPLIVATGEIGLAVVNPQTAEVLFRGPFPGRSFRGEAVSVGRLSDRDIAVVAGREGAAYELVVIDITDPRAPQVLQSLTLQNEPKDVVLNGELALIGGALAQDQSQVSIVNVGNPRLDLPFEAGQIQNVGGRVAVAETGVLFTSMPATFGGDVPLGGVRAATLGLLPVIHPIRPPLAREVTSGALVELETLESIDLTTEVLGADDSVTAATITLRSQDPRGGPLEKLAEWSVSLVRILGRLTAKLAIPPGFRTHANRVVTAVTSVTTSGATAVSAPAIVKIMGTEVQFDLTKEIRQDVAVASGPIGTVQNASHIAKVAEPNIPTAPAGGAKAVAWIWEPSGEVDLAQFLTSESDVANTEWIINGTLSPSSIFEYGSEPCFGLACLTCLVPECVWATAVEVTVRHRVFPLSEKFHDSMSLVLIPRQMVIAFEQWYQQELADMGWTAELPAPYPCLAAGNRDPEPGCPQPFKCWKEPNLKPSNAHPGAVYEMRSEPTEHGHGHQAMYNAAGRLITQGIAAGAGTADRVPPEDIRIALHFVNDVRPFAWAAQLDGNSAPFNVTDFDRPLVVIGTHLGQYLQVRPTTPTGVIEGYACP